jgi:Ca-activated chloride channel family protein
MRFADPQFLWLYLLVPVVVLGGLGMHVRRLRRFAGGEAQLARFEATVSVHRRAAKTLLVYVSLAALPAALARPQWGARLEQVTSRGVDVAIVLDTSLSMLAEDVAPSRLEQARFAIDSLLDWLEGDRVSLVTFAGVANVSCPLTVDHAAVRLFLGAVDAEIVQSPGSAVGPALEAALASLDRGAKDSGARGRAIVLFTDGEDHGGGVEEAIEQCSRAGVAVHAVGAGSPAGSPIPLRDATGVLGGYKKDREGQVVTTRLNESVLERIALDSGGRYYRATAAGSEVEAIARAIRTLEEGEIGAALRTRYEERFQIPLFLAWLALMADTLLGDRRRSARAAREAARPAPGPQSDAEAA